MLASGMMLDETLLSLPQLTLDDTVIERAAHYGFLLDRKGKIVPTTDILIASAAYEQAVVLHVDRDFETIGSIISFQQEWIGAPG